MALYFSPFIMVKSVAVRLFYDITLDQAQGLKL